MWAGFDQSPLISDEVFSFVAQKYIKGEVSESMAVFFMQVMEHLAGVDIKYTVIYDVIMNLQIAGRHISEHLRDAVNNFSSSQYDAIMLGVCSGFTEINLKNIRRYDMTEIRLFNYEQSMGEA